VICTVLFLSSKISDRTGPGNQGAISLEHRLNVVEEVSSLDMMLTLVGAGYGIGFMTATKIPISQRPDVVIRPLAQDTAVITTYLLRPESSNSSVSLDRFIERLRGPPDD
ncbi:LysR substrate-binding domain-containing protein, partial [Pseudomonas aeruginosa]|uniref:LysR substrate-binding domain-containing protein n=1 Tax=Pseudomonas aeruginosa TaxID=287 RepID=UPI00402BBE29